MSANWPRWFGRVWAGDKRRRVLEGYRALGAQHPATLADIALRNNVFTALTGDDAIALAIAEGRRRCAVEIFALCNIDTDLLWQQIEKKEIPQ